MSRKVCLMLNVVSFTELRSAQNYIIKLRSASLSANREIDYLFKDGLEYVYQLWPCRLDTLQQINIDVYRRENMKIIKIGTARPILTCSLQGQRYKFKEQKSSNNQLFLHFRVEMIQKDQKKVQKQLINLNNQMQYKLSTYKNQIKNYQDFLQYTNQIIKQINSNESEVGHNLSRPKEYKISPTKQKNNLINQKDIKQSQDLKLPLAQSNVQIEENISRVQNKEKVVRQSNNIRTKKQQYNTQPQQKLIVNKALQNKKNSIIPRKLSRQDNFEQEQKQEKKLKLEQKQEIEQEQNCHIKKNEQNKIKKIQQKTSLSASFNEITKKSILSKYPYLERTSQKIINNLSLNSSDDEGSKDKPVQLQNNHLKNSKKRKKVHKLGNTQISQRNKKNTSLDNQQFPLLDRSRLKLLQPQPQSLQLQVVKKQENQQKQKLNIQIKKRRQMYRNLETNKERYLDPIVEQNNNESMIDKLSISVVKSFSHKRNKYHEKNNEINELIKSPPKPNELTNSSSNDFSGLKSRRMPTQRQVKDNNVSIPQKTSLISGLNDEYNNSKDNEKSQFSPIIKKQKVDKQKSDTSLVTRVLRRKKHSNFTQNSKQSIIGSFYHVQNSLKEGMKKQVFDIDSNWNITIFFIKATTYTVYQNKWRRCIIESGRSKFQTQLKQGTQNCVEWNDKIVIKNVAGKTHLNLDVVSLNNKKEISEGTLSIRLSELYQVQQNYFKGYLNKNNLAVGHIQFKFQLEQQSQSRKTISLPQIKQPSKAEIKNKDQSKVKIVIGSESNESYRTRRSEFSLFPKQDQGMYFEQSDRQEKRLSKIRQKKLQCHPRIK